MSIEYRIGDVFDRLAEIPDDSIDLIVTSPPFLALRSYLPADHPDKDREIGSEPSPSEFLDTLLALSAEWGRVLAPHGSLCVELGDTYSGIGGGDAALSYRMAINGERSKAGKNTARDISSGWPLAKSKTMIDTLYPACLAYGRNLLTGNNSPAGQWRIRNLIVWARPNPPVGALGDKFRPATSYITVACRGTRRYFDLDAVRTEHDPNHPRQKDGTRHLGETNNKAGDNPKRNDTHTKIHSGHPAGAPPLDWHADHHPEDGDWLWKLSIQPYKGSHYATFPMTLPKRLIEAMCPLRVCTVCGKPSERIVDARRVDANGESVTGDWNAHNAEPGKGYTGSQKAHQRTSGTAVGTEYTTLGWTDCECSTDGTHWRTGVTLDPFAGSGTTLAAAQGVGRHAIGIDLDERNADLARERVGMFMEVAS